MTRVMEKVRANQSRRNEIIRALEDWSNACTALTDGAGASEGTLLELAGEVVTAGDKMLDLIVTDLLGIAPETGSAR